MCRAREVEQQVAGDNARVPVLILVGRKARNPRELRLERYGSAPLGCDDQSVHRVPRMYQSSARSAHNARSSSAIAFGLFWNRLRRGKPFLEVLVASFGHPARPTYERALTVLIVQHAAC
jgi:hypothetical protein